MWSDWISFVLNQGFRPALSGVRQLPSLGNCLFSVLAWCGLYLSYILGVTDNSARCIRVLTTPLLCSSGCLILKLKYWSVWVSLRKTLVLIEPSSCKTVTMPLSPLRHPSRVLDFLFSDSLNVFINSLDVVCEALWILIVQNDVRIVHIPLPPVQGRISRGQSFLFKRLQYMLQTMGDKGNP